MIRFTDLDDLQVFDVADLPKGNKTGEKFHFKVSGRAVLQQTEVGVEPLDEAEQYLRSADGYPMGEDCAAVSLRLQDLLLHVVDGPVGDVDAPRLDDAAYHRQSLRSWLYVHLVRMELKV